TIAPKNSEINAGGTQLYTAEGFDAHGNSLGDATGGTDFPIDDPGTCSGTACGAEKAGTYTVTGTDGTFTDTATLKVDATELASITIAPKNSEINAGGTQLYTAEGFDAHGNPLGDATGGTVFSIDDPGTCSGTACRSEERRVGKETSTRGTLTDTTTHKVDATELASITIAPKNSEINAGGTQLYTDEGFDANGNF